MSLVHLVMPSKRPASEVNRRMAEWLDRGYRVVLQRDPGECDWIDGANLLVLERPYAGYPEAVNWLARRSLAMDPECQWIVAAGDDTQPDPCHTADEIATQCSDYFLGLAISKATSAAMATDPRTISAAMNEASKTVLFQTGAVSHIARIPAATFGVMQPTGDRWGADDPYAQATWPDAPAMIDRICGSPWMGRTFCERINQGNGPLWCEYFHNWADEELQCVAKRLGILWQRRDLIHYHDHARRHGGDWLEHQKGFDADYKRMEPVFRARKQMGFPGSEPL